MTGPNSPIATSSLLDDLTTTASIAGAAILALRAPGIDWSAKPDASPVTAADHASQELIVADLQRLLPGLPIVSEEAELPARFSASRFALVDPLDGTKEFIAGGDDFTVNIALVEDGVPVLGIIAAPALGLIWRGMAGRGAERLALTPGRSVKEVQTREAIHVRSRPADGLTVAVSRSHLDAKTLAFLTNLPVAQQVAVGSAVKLARVAEGSADLYPRLAPTCEWDIAAGHAVVTAAGGCVVRADGTALTYGHTERSFIIPGFIAWGDPSAAKAA